MISDVTLTKSHLHSDDALDVSRVLKFAVKQCAIDKTWLTPDEEEIRLLIDIKAEAKADTPAIKPDQLLKRLERLEDVPECRLAVGFVGFYGVKPAELLALSFIDR